MYTQDLATYHAECERDGFGPIGMDDCPTSGVVVRMARKRQNARTRRLARMRREPGERAIRKVCRRAKRVGIDTQPTLRAYVTHAFGLAGGIMPNPDRMTRVVREFAPDMPEPFAPLPMRDADPIPADWAEALNIAAELDRADGIA